MQNRCFAEPDINYLHHDHARPQPPVVTPATPSTQDQPGLCPDAHQSPKLNAREKEVLDQLAKGFLYKEIEENLNISPGTLRRHIANIYEQFHVHSRTEAVVKYLKR
jgi:DNA-binding NarL/FixJ family response regulator